MSGELVPKEDRRRWRRRRRSEEQFNPLPGSYSTLPSPPRHEFSFSQPGEPEMKTYLTSHVSPAHRHTHHWRDNYSLTQGRAGAGRVEKDAMTGEPRQGGRAHSFSPNRHHYHGNTGHQQKFVGGAYRIHDNGLVPHGNGTGVRAGTRRGSGDHSKSWEEKGPVDWEVSEGGRREEECKTLYFLFFLSLSSPSLSLCLSLFLSSSAGFEYTCTEEAEGEEE